MPGPGPHVSDSSRYYVNPFPGSLVKGGRVDEGLDPTIKGPIVAIGDAIVETVTQFSGFGTYVAYKLLSGPRAGQRVYISEGIAPHVRAGQRVQAGQQIATGTGAIETGWAGGPVGRFLPVANKAQGGDYTEGKATAAGHDFNGFLRSLGVNAGPGGTKISVGAAGKVAGAILEPPSANDPFVKAGEKVGGAAKDAATKAAEAGFTAGFNALWGAVGSKAEYGALFLLAVIAGGFLIFTGASRSLGLRRQPA